MKCFKIHCQEPWFSLLKSGKKPVEGRKNSPYYQKIRVGDTIEFFEGSRNFFCQVEGINHYLSIEDYLTQETLERALPGVSSMDEGLSIYLAWNTREEIHKRGFLGIQVRVLKNGGQI